ncbi:hypothetical protein FALCPG4_002956 [Fusarium falciforme]
MSPSARERYIISIQKCPMLQIQNKSKPPKNANPRPTEEHHDDRGRDGANSRPALALPGLASNRSRGGPNQTLEKPLPVKAASSQPRRVSAWLNSKAAVPC